MVFDILTMFPEMFAGPFDHSILKRAREKGLVQINLHSLRRFAIDQRGTLDDRPYGGGTGMILRVEPIDRALNEVRNTAQNTRVVLLDARGDIFTQATARRYTTLDQLIIVCGHYEGVDERVREHLVDETVSIGNFVLTGGEIPAMVLVDTVARLIPKVLKKPEATQIESFSTPNDLEFPQYTRPEDYRGWKVPEILLRGNHQAIAKWRQQQALTRP